jgi:riboflavin biosynthesis pyrimidine reductase
MLKIYPAPAGAELGPVTQGGAGLAALADLYAYPPPGPRPWVRANMVASADGAASLAGRSGGLSSEADRQVFSVLRSLADVILVGAGTARAEKYQPVRPGEEWPDLRAGRSPAPPIAVLTRALDVDPDSPLLRGFPGSARTIVLTSRAAPADRQAAVRRHADLVVTGEDRVSPADAVAALASRGHHRVLLEGGPRLLAQVAGDGLLDELCLTISPLLAGGQTGRILQAATASGIPAGAAGLRLAHVLTDDGFLLCRYLRQ